MTNHLIPALIGRARLVWRARPALALSLNTADGTNIDRTLDMDDLAHLLDATRLTPSGDMDLTRLLTGRWLLTDETGRYRPITSGGWLKPGWHATTILDAHTCLFDGTPMLALLIGDGRYAVTGLDRLPLLLESNGMDTDLIDTGVNAPGLLENTPILIGPKNRVEPVGCAEARQ